MPFSPLDARSGEGVLGCNATCAEKVERLPPPFSSASALTLLGVVLVAIVALSLTTHRCHRGRMRRRKMERAQEEYERDQRSPVPARAKPDSGRCTIIRPAPRDAEAGSASSGQRGGPSDDPSITLPPAAEDVKGVEEAVLEAVAVS